MADKLNKNEKLDKVQKPVKGSKKKDKPQEKAADKIYTIPLKKARRRSVRKQSNAAMKVVKQYILTHTKADDVKIGQNLSKHMLRFSHRIPRKVRVNVFMVDTEDGKVANTELLGQAYEEKKAEEKKATGVGMAERLKARLGSKALQKQEEEEKIEGKSKDKNKKVKEPQKLEVPSKE